MREWARRHRAHGGYDRWVRRTDAPLLVVSVLFVVALLVPIVDRDLPAAAERALTGFNVAVWVVFAVDYAVRLYLAPRRGEFVRRHVPDLVVVAVPLLRPLRAVRLLRLVRLSAVAGRLVNVGRRSLHSRVATLIGVVTVLAIVVSAAAMVEAERDAPNGNIKSYPDALWWASTTVTTVGYGDRYPVTAAGRAVAVALMLVGIALLGVLTAAVAAWFVERLTTTRSEVEESIGRETRVLLDAIEDLRVRLDRLESRER